MAKGDRHRGKRQKHLSAVAARRAEQARLTRVDQVPLPPDAERYVVDVLARRQETADARWLAALQDMGKHGHPGEAIEQIEPFVRDHLYDEQAALTYAQLLCQAAALEPKGDRERKALERFTDRSGLAETRRAVMQYLERHPDWDEFVKDRAVQDFQLVPGKRLSAGEAGECAALILEANVRGADLAMKGKISKQTVGLHRGNHHPRTALMVFADDPATPPHLAKRAADWTEYGHYGLWQLQDPAPSPGVEGMDLALSLLAPRSLDAGGGLIMFGGDDQPGMVDFKVKGAIHSAVGDVKDAVKDASKP